MASALVKGDPHGIRIAWNALRGKLEEFTTSS
jgi:hypothetical protein